MSTPTTYRVLLVDDEHASFEFVQAMLRQSHDDYFDLSWISDFDEALEAICQEHYDACLLDYNLGDRTGLELMEATREQNIRIPIILLTGYGSREVDLDALQAGVTEYLDKSHLKPVLLERTIRYAIRMQQDKNELGDLYQQVRELENLKTDMIRIAAHDLRTPLMSALNYANFLRDDKDNPLQDYQVGYAEEIVGSVRRMQSIISDILSLERIQETAAERYEHTVDLVSKIQQAAEVSMSNERDLNYVVDTPEVGTITVKGDAPQLMEAATNLITNAIKYTPDGGTITVTLTQSDGTATFSVQDTGFGIPTEMQERLFQPFYRAKSRETRHISGTGLGLHLVRNIIQRHRGEIFFHSVYGEGSTFGFRIPLLNASS